MRFRKRKIPTNLNCRQYTFVGGCGDCRPNTQIDMQTNIEANMQDKFDCWLCML